MPVILDKQEESLWLSRDIGVSDLLGLCDSYPDEKIKAFRVSTAVNSTVVNKKVNNVPELMSPLNSL